MAAIVDICVCMIQDTRMTIHSIPYKHKAILGATSHGRFVFKLCWFDSHNCINILQDMCIMHTCQ